MEMEMTETAEMTAEQKAAAAAAAAEAKAAEAAEKARLKEEAKAAKAAEAAAKKAEKEAAKLEAAAKKEAEKAAKAAAKEAEKAAQAAAKEAAKMPESNGIRRPKPDTLCGKAWAIFDQISAQNGSPASIGDSLAVAKPMGLNEANVRAEYARWRKFFGVSGRIPAAKPEAAPAPAAA